MVPNLHVNLTNTCPQDGGEYSGGCPVRCQDGMHTSINES